LTCRARFSTSGRATRYTEREKTRFEHQWEIPRARGYREFADAEEEFSGWVAARSRATGNGPKAIFTDGVAWLRPDGLPAALPAPERLAAVRVTGLLDTGPEGPFDDLARLAGAATGPGRTRRGGNQGANPALALISVPQQGRAWTSRRREGPLGRPHP